MVPLLFLKLDDALELELCPVAQHWLGLRLFVGASYFGAFQPSQWMQDPWSVERYKF
jgi:hypothetical protein